MQCNGDSTRLAQPHEHSTSTGEGEASPEEIPDEITSQLFLKLFFTVKQGPSESIRQLKFFILALTTAKVSFYVGTLLEECRRKSRITENGADSSPVSSVWRRAVARQGFVIGHFWVVISTASKYFAVRCFKY